MKHTAYDSFSAYQVKTQHTERENRTRTETKPKNSHPEAAIRKCPHCRAEALLSSGVYGLREQILFLLGASHFRCRKCQTRHAQLGSLAIRLSDPRKDKTSYAPVVAIVSGLIAYLAIVLCELRRAHRWPF